MSIKDLYSRAASLHRNGKLVEAEQLYRQILATDSNSFAAQHMLGVLAAQAGRVDEALELLLKALTINPSDFGALVNVGNVLSLQGRMVEACTHYDRALAIRPDADVFRNRGHALQVLGRWEDALASYQQALALNGRDVQALYKTGVILTELGRSDEAIACYDQVLALQPNHVEALNNRGFAWWLGRKNYEHAIADLQRALALEPSLPYGAGAVLHLHMYAAHWDSFEQEKIAIETGVRNIERVARPFMFQAVSANPKDLQTCARIYAQDLFPPLSSAPFEFSSRKLATKIRLGYVSGEFREQATSSLMAGLYEIHDRSRFELVAIDNASADQSMMSARLKRAFDHWIDIGTLDDQAAARKIHAAGIDILINLNGWFGKHRMGVFAYRPAPIQVNYLGFPGTLGAPYIDYIIADNIVIPDGEHQFYDEKVVTLPGCYQANDNRGREVGPKPTRQDEGLSEQNFVYCNFNQSYKLTPQTFCSWMRILKEVDGSVLWLLEAVSPFAQNIAQHARSHGVDPARILFAPDRPMALHLARLSLADLFLDSLPYNAHTTASDALWAGVPLVTQRGTTFPGRVAASLLYAVGLPEMVTENTADFEALAIELGRNPDRLAAVKARISPNAPLFDTDLFRRGIEQAYEKMWQIWCSGAKPQSFSL